MNTVPPRASRTQDYDPEEDDAYYTQRPHTSAIRYTQPRQHIIQRGNKRIVIHDEPPPKQPKHWLVFIGIGMIVSLLLWAGVQMLGTWWSAYQLDATYGFPRTSQADAVVGHDDSTDHPTHFILTNLRGRVDIIELPGGQVAHARIYSGPTIVGDNPGLIPVTAEFEDVNGDGKIDMIVHIGNQQFTYLNDGTQFKPQQ